MIPTSLKKAVCGYVRPNMAADDRNALVLCSSFVPRKGHVNAYVQERDRDTRVVLYPHLVSYEEDRPAHGMIKFTESNFYHTINKRRSRGCE